jgi:type IV pilus assembly protein PilV
MLIPRKLATSRQSARILRRESGFSLIEILISVLILAIGMLGIASLQSNSLRSSQSAYESSQAVMLTYSILDAMRANRPVAGMGGYDLPTFTCAPPDPGDLKQNDWNAWINALKANLGDSACGRISCSLTQCEIQVRWNDERVAGGSSGRIVTTRTRL